MTMMRLVKIVEELSSQAGVVSEDDARARYGAGYEGAIIDAGRLGCIARHDAEGTLELLPTGRSFIHVAELHG